MRRLILLAAIVLLTAFAWWFSRRERGETGAAAQPARVAEGVTSPRSEAARAPGLNPGPAVNWEQEFPIVAPLNRPESTIARDLDTLSQVFDAWRTNFPRAGNPVGENAEITAALTGDNQLGLALIPKTHPAINASGELCDRWGTPFRFHQLSGERMEIRSAGPDRKFATEDDALWSPP